MCVEQLHLAFTFNDLDLAGFNASAFAIAVAADMGVAASQISGLTVTAGSVVVTFQLLPAGDADRFEPETLETLVATVTSGNLTAVAALDYGDVSAVATTPAQQRAAAAALAPPAAAAALASRKEKGSQVPLIVGCSAGGVAALLGGAAVVLWRKSRQHVQHDFRRHQDSPVHPE